MPEITYKEVAREVMADTEGANLEQVSRAVRDATRDIAGLLRAIQGETTWNATEDNLYAITHPGWDWHSMMGVWAEYRNPKSRIDESQIYDLSAGASETTFSLPNITGVSKIIASYALIPDVSAEAMPSLFWSQYTEAIRYGALSRLHSYIRPVKRGIPTPNYSVMYDDEIRKAKRRSNTLPGPDRVQPFVGNEGDTVQTFGGYGLISE